MRTAMKKLTALCLTLLMIGLLSFQAVAAGISDAKSYSPVLPDSISLGSNSYARLVNANLIPTDSGNTLMTTIRYYNGGNTELNMSDYWIRYKLKGSNQTFTAKLVSSGASVEKIPAKSLVYITFYGNVNSDVTLDQLQVQFIKWDFSVSNFERTLALVDIPANVFTAPAGEKYNVQMTGINLDTLVNKVLISRNESYYKTTVYFTLENKAKMSLKLPALKYYVLTTEGILYSLEQSQVSENVTIEPHTSVDLVLRGNIPSSIKEGGWKLVVVMPVSEVNVPIASYTLPKTTQITETDFNKEMLVTDSNGLYKVVINSVSRLPLEDQDILTATLTITNNDTETLPVPNLTGKYMLDGVVNLEASLIQPDKILGIRPNESTTAYFYALVPYTYDFAEVTLVLQEKGETDNAGNNTLLEVTGSNVITDLVQIAPGNEYRIDNIGSSSSFKALTTRVYESSTAEIFSTQVDATNLEKRLANVPSLAAYYKLPDGTIFPATVSKVDAKMSPGGKTLLDIYTTISKVYSMEDAVLILGEAIEEASGESPTMVAYVNPVELQLPEEERPIDNVTDVNLYPYTLSISRVTSSVNYTNGRLTVGFDYIFNKTPLVEVNTENKRIVLEIEDEDNDILFTNEYFLENAAGNSTAGVFEIGEHKGTFIAEDQEMILKIKTMNSGFTLKVYEQLESGYKKLLGSKEMQWFVTNP